MTEVRLDDLDQTPDGAAILDETETFFRRFVAFPSDYSAIAVTLWAAHTHALERFSTSGRAAFLSPEPDSGKTRALEILELLCPRALLAVDTSTAALFRLIESRQPTILLDEVDTIFTHRGKDEDNADLRGLINSGYRRGATVPRCYGPNHDVRMFPVYAACALAGLGDLPDTLMRRSLVIRMRRRDASREPLDDFDPELHTEKGHALADRIAGWFAAVELPRLPEMPTGVVDRPREVWRPLLAVADAAGGNWPKRAREACIELVKGTDSRDASLGVRLLGDLRTVFGDADALSTSVILTRLKALEEAPWDDLRGKALDSRRLARMLSDYQVTSGDVHVVLDDGTRKTRKGYTREALHDAWGRYLPPPEDAQERQARQERSPSAQEGLPGADSDPGADTSAPGFTSAPGHGAVTSNGASGADGAPTAEPGTDLPLRYCQGCGEPVETGNEFAARRHVGCPEQPAGSCAQATCGHPECRTRNPQTPGANGAGHTEAATPDQRGRHVEKGDSMKTVRPAATGFNWADHIGRTLLVLPIREQETDTSNGTKPTIVATVRVRDDSEPRGYVEHEDVYTFGAVLVPQLRKNIGDWTLGVLNEKENGARRLDDPTDDDVKWSDALPEPGEEDNPPF